MDKEFTALKGGTPPPKTTAPPQTAAPPKKGDEKQVQGGTAIFDGTKWVMKK